MPNSDQGLLFVLFLNLLWHLRNSYQICFRYLEVIWDRKRKSVIRLFEYKKLIKEKGLLTFKPVPLQREKQVAFLNYGLHSFY